MTRLSRFLGGAPSAVLLRLALLSLLVGAALSAFGLTPPTVLAFLRALLARLTGDGLATALKLAEWLFYGALVVVPLWLTVRLAALGQGSERAPRFETARTEPPSRAPRAARAR